MMGGVRWLRWREVGSGAEGGGRDRGVERRSDGRRGREGGGLVERQEGALPW